MTPHEARGEVDELIVVLLQIGLLVRSKPTIIHAAPPLTWVTWAGAADSLPIGGESVAEYRAILRTQDYNCLLADGGVIQISYAFEGWNLKKYRFSWIPAPVVVDREAAQSEDVANLVDDGLADAGLQILDDDAGEDLLLIAP